MPQTLTKTNMTLLEAVDSLRKDFEKENGGFLTEEEAVKWVDEIRSNLKQQGEL